MLGNASITASVTQAPVAHLHMHEGASAHTMGAHGSLAHVCTHEHHHHMHACLRMCVCAMRTHFPVAPFPSEP